LQLRFNLLNNQAIRQELLWRLRIQSSMDVGHLIKCRLRVH
jgi:hypothetical protein